MCCDGTLYAYVTLIDDDEVKALREVDASLTIVERHQRLCFDQPCRFHTPRGCSAYDKRPDTCSRYFCALLRAVERDELTTDQARLIIEEALARVENVKEYVHFEPGMPIAASTWISLPEHASADAMAAWSRALTYLREHFLGPEPDAPSLKPAV